MAVVALAWVHDRPAVASVILGARTTAQLRQNLAVVGTHLEAAEAARLDEVSTPAVGDYPYGELGADQRARAL
jgi:aryl-alcohol dehydrogenase-like predicted oxidoreductase